MKSYISRKLPAENRMTGLTPPGAGPVWLIVAWRLARLTGFSLLSKRTSRASEPLVPRQPAPAKYLPSLPGEGASKIRVVKPTWARRLGQWLIPGIILLLAAGIVLLITGNWNTWA